MTHLQRCFHKDWLSGKINQGGFIGRRGKHGFYCGELRKHENSSFLLIFPDVFCSFSCMSSSSSLAVQLANTIQSINNESGHITEYKTHLFSHPGESPPLGLQIFLTFFELYFSLPGCLSLFVQVSVLPVQCLRIRCFTFLSTIMVPLQPQELTDILEISNMVFTSLFSLEMLLKLLALGLFGYIKNPYNGFDSIIVIIR